MPSFALISEGLTDHVILERIIEQICGEMFDDDVDVNPLQPLRDATDAAATPLGGWEFVLEYCEQRAMDALVANDYVVIHLDTDQGDHPNFGVRLTDQGVSRSYDALVADAIEIIITRLGYASYREYTERFLFAISVHSMESWLLLCLFDRDEPQNSMDRLNRQLRKSGQKPLVKEVHAYKQIARAIKYKKLKMLSTRGNSLSLFLTQLSALDTSRVEET